MKQLGSSGDQGVQLLQMLRKALQRQAGKWTPIVYKQPVNKDVEVSPEQRDDIVRWMGSLKRRFSFYPETLMLSVAILDKFLHSVKVRPKYLRCVGITCFYLAAKTCEEDEVIPATSELVEESECGRTVAEVLRMEPLILGKLGWDLNLTTPLDFIHIFHALIMSKIPHLLDRSGMTPSQQIAALTHKLTRCMENHSYADVQPSVLAASLLSLELETLQPKWLPITVWLQNLTDCSKDSLIRCREQLSRCICVPLPGALPPFHAVTAAPTCFGGSVKRKVEQMEVDDADDDNIYDGIKLLYSEDLEPITVPPLSRNASCGRELQQQGFVTPPALAAVTN